MRDAMTRRTFVATAMAGAAAMAAHTRAAEATAPIDVAVVGCAHIHLPSFLGKLKARSDMKVKYVWDHDVARAQMRAQEIGALVVDDARRIWSDPQVKAVVICSETNRHHELVMAAAQAGKHMFAEKPLGISGKESFEMADAIEKAKVLFTTGYFFRSMPQHLFIKEQIEKGALGMITRVRGSTCHNGSLGGWFDKEWRWMADPKVAGVGAFGDLGTHSLDLLMWMIGDVEAVTADIKVVTRRYGDCDESGEALIRFKNGVTGTLAAGWVDVANPVTLLVSGTEGHAAIVNDQLYFQSSKAQGATGRSPWKEFPAALPHPLDMFLNAVAGKTPAVLVSPREAAARAAVMEAMYRSARERKWASIG